MIVVHKQPSILDQIDHAIFKSIMDGKPIDHIVLTDDEMETFKQEADKEEGYTEHYEYNGSVEFQYVLYKDTKIFLD